MAKSLKKPFYVAVESYKFARMYPFNQRDVAEAFSVPPNSIESEKAKSKFTMYNHPTVDFTPAEYISLLFTDLGVLTPAAVSDELIKLYQ